MATLQITEYDKLAVDSGGHSVPVGLEKSLAVQNVTYSTATSSSALNERTRIVRLIADVDAHVNFGGTATVSSTRLEANVAEYFGVHGGETISVYDGAS